jgi:hypothetical protein
LSSLLSTLRRTPRRIWILYLVVYCSAGGVLQAASPRLQIAAFYHDWQVLTLYGLFLVPLSILLRGRPWHVQYAYAVTAIAPVDIGGFALGTSIAYPNNIIERAFGPLSFTLVFVILAGWMPLLGNLLVARLEGWLFNHRWAPQRALARVYDAEILPLARIELGEGDHTAPSNWQ